ncbi:MAG: TldD/PmbA family protein, partial [Bacillota bacterium]|nr:TldD/PmbA family protein [Bacillota bacterium]
QKQMLDNAMAYALKHGADQCEFYLIHSSGESLSMRGGVLNDDNRAEKVGFSVRLMKNNVPGFSYGAVAEPASLRRAIDDALVATSFLEPDPHFHFTEGGLAYPSLPAFELEDISRKEKMELLESMASIAQSKPKIARAERVSYAANSFETTIVNSLGLDLQYRTCFHSASAVAVAEDVDETETGGHYMVDHSFYGLSAKEIAETAAENGSRRLKAKVIDGGEYPIVLDAEAVIDLMSLLIPSFLGDNLYKGKSRLKGRDGEIIAPSCLTITDDPLLVRGVSATPFDDEGMPSASKALIQEGRIQSFLHNHVSASHCHTQSTGNGYCGSHKTLTSVGISNCYVLAGSASPDELRRGISHGLWVRDLMGLHMADSITGDFSLGISGSLIEHGELGGSFRGVMIAGNIFELLEDIETTGSDFVFFSSSGAPSIKIKSMKISGK